MLATTVQAQQHGAGISKSCTKLRRCSGQCSASTSIPCLVNPNCPPGETCILGDVCTAATAATDCAGRAPFCIGDVTASFGILPHACSSVADCRAASECSPCVPLQVPLAAVTAGDTMDCEIVVANRDSFPLATDQHSLVIHTIADEIFHSPPVGTELINIFAPGSTPMGTISGECLPRPSPTMSQRCSATVPCPAGQTCSLDLECVNLNTNVVGGPCSTPGAACSPPASGTCSVILPEGITAANRIGSFVIADHTDLVQATDAPTLLDKASTLGNDLDVMVPPGALSLDTTLTIGVTTTTTLPPPAGCRITGGGTVNGLLDPNVMAEITKAQFSGQVGAPCGCFGCFDKFDPKLASVQGNWNHQRKNKGGSLHANTFNSLVCSCLGGVVGDLCPDAEHPTTPADHICITGIGQFVPDTGNKTPLAVAFRFEATDRGEPGNNDFYEMHIFTPRAGQTVEQLAEAICCTNPISVLPQTGVVANDQGLLIAGNVQIHRALAKSTDGLCPPPRGVCTPINP